MKWILLLLLFARCSGKSLPTHLPAGADTITVPSGSAQLKGLLWRPAGKAPFPALIFCHGTYESADTRYDAVQQTSVLGPLFARNGYVFLGLFGRGTGLSKDQGENSADVMARVLKESGLEERNRVQLQQLQGVDLQDMVSGLAALRRRKDVDSNRIAIIGHSYGGSLALLVAEQEPYVKAVVVFGAAGYSWGLSPLLRERLSGAVRNIRAPVMLVYAQNDYSTLPAYALDSIMELHHKPHELRVYPSFGHTQTEGHNLAFLSPRTWEADVVKFLRKSL